MRAHGARSSWKKIKKTLAPRIPSPNNARMTRSCVSIQGGGWVGWYSSCYTDNTLQRINFLSINWLHHRASRVICTHKRKPDLSKVCYLSIQHYIPIKPLKPLYSDSVHFSFSHHFFLYLAFVLKP